ncbi:glycosyltransferase family 2 protein [Saccharopolyspora phatthalungensis]|uniref:Glycosyltransferase involved in cell wall biosynthesis n=1 Tax=Saccharopolyspora phatthalungensis TaxID=664693 RepID=A0A840QGR3_9PSEU|nr:glycosyltransferase family 2 protein [Saccharopolyspora phatthalungensis]MBB5157948.1 glycosyltransferase involved in cell wall biosynthesis [Saccharopolyspora phatthalungensis]
MAYDDTWLIVPVYNEGPVVEGLVRDALQTFPNIVCVDDGSQDESAECILRAGAHLVRHPVNLGQGAALQTGIEYARRQPGARYFVTFDADGQHQVVDVQRMLVRLRDGEVDIVVGTRFHDSTRHIPLTKRILLRTVVMLSPRLRMLDLTDAHNGLRAFNRTVADQMNITHNGMGHASEIIDMVRRHSWRIAEEPVTILYTEYSKAKGQSVVNGVNIVFESVLRSGSRR